MFKSHRYYDLGESKPLGPWTKIRYNVEYTLVKIGEEWFVNVLKFSMVK